MKKILSFILLIFVSIGIVYSNSNIDHILAMKDDLETITLAVASSYLSVPKIELEGVTFTQSDGLLPKETSFLSSDVSTYYMSLTHPKNSGLLSFIARISSSVSPLSQKAISALEDRNFQKGEMIIDGNIKISGESSLTLSTILFGKDFSNIMIDISGNLTLTGYNFDNGVSIDFKLHCIGDENRAIAIYIDELNIDKVAVSITPIIVSLESF